MVNKCPICNSDNDDQSKFCSSCGKPLVAPSSVKSMPGVKIVSPIAPPSRPVTVPSPGMCFYHQNLPAMHVCSRCGKPICRDDSKRYHSLVMCPQCYPNVRF